MNKDIKLSNIKGLLIFLVVFGHLLAPYQEKFNGLYLFIYSFHMPLFVLVSGYFAKRVTYKKVINFILLYLLFQLLYQSFLVLIKPGHVFDVEYEDPYYHLWYLVSMAAWCLIAIGIKKWKLTNVNKVIFLLGCFAVGIVSKFFTPFIVTWMKTYNSSLDSYTLSFQRTLSFLPFFILGLFLTRDNMNKLYTSLRGNKLLSIIAILGVFAYYTFADSTNLENILKGSYGIDEMTGSLLSVTGQIIIAYIFALIMCYVFLNLMSNKPNILTKWGDCSLTIFLFHIFITRTMKTFNFLKELNSWVLLPLLFITALIIVCVFSSDAFVNATYILAHPYEIIDRLIKRKKPEVEA